MSKDKGITRGLTAIVSVLNHNWDRNLHVYTMTKEFKRKVFTMNIPNINQ